MPTKKPYYKLVIVAKPYTTAADEAEAWFRHVVAGLPGLNLADGGSK